VADGLGLVQRWTDSILGDFNWQNGVWNGSCEFHKRPVPLQLDPDNTNPTQEEQLAIFELSRPILDRLREVEPEFRRKAAEQIASAVISQQPRSQKQASLPKEPFSDDLDLQIISIHGCGELHYHSPKFFPGWVVTIYFTEGITFGGAEVDESPKAAK
jgi:hypothetical protein